MQFVNQNLTEIIAILDRSGSMESSIDDVIGGFNSLVEKQRALPGECRVTLVIFDNLIDTLYEDVPIAEVQSLTREQFFARDFTALSDAVGSTIDRAGRRYASIPFERRPSKVVVFISTDGRENASKEYNTKQVREMIKHQQENYQWHVVFTGADIDSYDIGATLGVAGTTTINYGKSAMGVQTLYSVVSNKLGALRSNVIDSMDFSAEEKQEVEQHASSTATKNQMQTASTTSKK